MQRGLLAIILIMAILGCSVIGTVTAQMQDSTEYDCETCTMKVGTQAQNHLQVYDGNGTRHWVECIGCALKLLNTYDTIHIQTYCDWYGPNATITIDISQHGKETTVTPTTSLLLIGGGCTGNRVAYNQTAAENLLANGYSQYTMMMMQQPLPSNTNITSFPARALIFNQPKIAPESTNYNVPIIIGVVGVIVIVLCVFGYKKLLKRETP
jgi:hypothetical protein